MTPPRSHNIVAVRQYINVEVHYWSFVVAMRQYINVEVLLVLHSFGEAIH